MFTSLLLLHRIYSLPASFPLQPCGACNEWLKKIAEVNPQFQIVTYTDAHCHGVYVESVSEF